MLNSYFHAKKPHKDFSLRTAFCFISFALNTRKRQFLSK